MLTINNFNSISDNCILITDSQEVAIFNIDYSKDYDGYLVASDNGDIKKLYGFYGSVPYLDKKVFEIIVK